MQCLWLPVSLAVLLLPLSALAAAPGTFDLFSYGGIGDGSTLNTAAFRAAIAAAHAYSSSSGGSPGTVLVHDGVFFSGQIQLLSGVWLSVAPSARLLASANASDYPADQSRWAFLYAAGAENIGVTGGGTLDGNFQQYIGGWSAANDEFIPQGWPGCSGECRPRLAMLINSSTVTVSSVTFTGSPDWTFHLLNCSHVHVFNWTQFGDERWPNNDGIDLDSCSHVLLENSTINTADDGVCIKGSAVGGSSTNVTVRNCRLRSRSSAVKFGSNCPIGFSNFLFEDLTVWDSNRGLALQARDGGLLQDITFRRIDIQGTRFWPWKWWGDGGALYISTMLRTPGDPSCSVRNVTFEDITARSQGASVLSGAAPGQTLQGITLRRVSLLIDTVGNYSATNVSGPSIEYDPSTAVRHTRVNMSGWMSGM
jgi:polygalacturonase